MSDQLVTEDATYIIHNKHNRRTSMLSAGFEPAIPVAKRLQTYAIDRTAARIDETQPCPKKFFQLWNRISEMKISYHTRIFFF
jgi:hypothetical protein